MHEPVVRIPGPLATQRWLLRLLQFAVAVLIVRVTVGIVANYGAYLPADFEADFLRGRERYFYGAYSVAFYAHIVSGPMVLLAGLLLMSEGLRTRFARWHRRLGRFQVASVLLVLAPSGFWMAWYAEDVIARVGFALLAIFTGASATLGWRAAVQRRFAEHRRWMSRCFLLLCSAVVLRLIGGLSEVTGIGGQWSYPAAAWISWLLPLAVFEWHTRWSARSLKQSAVQSQLISSTTALSSPAMEMSARR